MKKIVYQLGGYLVLGLLLVSAKAIGQATVYGPGCVGVVSGPYPTISAAIAAASPGQCIVVAPGLYNENLVIAKTLTIRGARAGVDARGRVIGLPNPLVESIIVPLNPAVSTLEIQGSGAANSIIDGFVFEGGTTSVIRTSTNATDGIKILNNDISGFQGGAIFLDKNATDVTISKNVMDGSSKPDAGAILFLDTDNFLGIHINDNWIQNAASGTGIFVHGDGNRNVKQSANREAVIKGNRISGNTTGMNAGSSALENVAFLENEISGNSGDGFIGGPKNSQFLRNTFSGNGRGIVFTSDGWNLVTIGAQGNYVRNNFFSGQTNGDMWFADQANGTQSSNIITENSFLSEVAIFNGEWDGGTDPINATCNWYGSASEAVVSTKIVNLIPSGVVNYVPFLTNGTDNDTETPGFQPVPESCNGPLTDPKISFTATNTRTNLGQSTELGEPLTVSVSFCEGDNLQLSGYSSYPENKVGMFTNYTASGEFIEAGNTYPANGSSSEVFPDGMSDFFSGTYGPYSLPGGSTHVSIDRTFQPYYDTNGDNNYDAGEPLGSIITLHYDIYANPTCSIEGEDPVCPSSTNTYSGPSGMTSYSWSITSGDGTISGLSNQQNVSVIAGSSCNTSFTLTLVVTNVNGCSSTCQKVVTVGDAEAPQLVGTIPTGLSGMNRCFNNIPEGPTEARIAAQYTDNCGPVTVVKSGSPTGTNCGWTVTYHYEIYDGCDNHAADVDITFSGSDQTPPSFTFCPPNTTINCQDNSSISATGNATATDNCSPVTITHSDVSTQHPDANNCAHYNYTITRTFTAKDVCLNTSNSCVQVITVHDVSAPTFTAPPATSISFSSIEACGYNSSPANTGNPTGSDNCSPVTMSYTDAIAECGNDLVITRTWKAKDVCLNESGTQTQTITVTDNGTDYIVYAMKEAKFGENNTFNGSVGVIDANGKAEFKKNSNLVAPHQAIAKTVTVHMPNNINAVSGTGATGWTPPIASAYNGGGLSGNYTQSTNAAVPLGNYKSLTIKKGVVTTIPGNNYGRITIEENADVTFTAGGYLDIEELKVKKGKNGFTQVKFSQCTIVRMKDGVDIEESAKVNVSGGVKVTFNMGKKEFSVKADNTTVEANVNGPEAKLKITGGDGGATMSGWYVVEKVEANAKNVTWNHNTTCNQAARGPLVATTASRNEPVVILPEVFSVKAFPNPTYTDFRLQINSPSEKPVSIRLVDLNGRTLKQISGARANSLVSLGIDLRSGTYFAEVQQGNNKQTVKLIKLD